MMNLSKGFSLPEVMISLLMVGILAAVTIPHFVRYLHHKTQQNYLYSLKQLLTYSRLYALQHQQTLVLCPSVDHVTCSADWQQGGILFVDVQGNRQHNSTESVLRILSPAPLGQQFTLTAFPDNRSLQFQPQRLLIMQSSSGSFQLCDEVEHRQLRLIFSNTGRFREEESAC